MIHDTDTTPVNAQLALHYDRAGRPEKAVMACHRAADSAKRVFAVSEAARLFRMAIEMLGEIRDSTTRTELELDLQTSLGTCLVASDGYPAPGVLKTYERAAALCRQLGHPTSGSILRALALSTMTIGQLERSHGYGRELLELHAAQGDHLLLVEGHFVVGAVGFWLGDFKNSRAALEIALEEYDPVERETHIASYAQDPFGICLCHLAWTLLHLGGPERSAEKMRKVLDYVGGNRDPHSEAYVRFFSVHWCLECGDLDQAEAQLTAAARVADEHSLGFWENRQMLLEGKLMVERNLVVEGLAKMEAAAEELDLENSVGGSQYLLWIGRACLRAGELARAHEAVVTALSYIDQSGERFIQSELHHLEGELILAGNGERTTAEEMFQRALKLATDNGSTIQKLRASCQLGALWAAQGKEAEACDLLEEVYVEFTEGFASEDLMNARATLEEWGWVDRTPRSRSHPVGWG